MLNTVLFQLIDSIKNWRFWTFSAKDASSTKKVHIVNLVRLFFLLHAVLFALCYSNLLIYCHCKWYFFLYKLICAELSEKLTSDNRRSFVMIFKYHKPSWVIFLAVLANASTSTHVHATYQKTSNQMTVWLRNTCNRPLPNPPTTFTKKRSNDFHILVNVSYYKHAKSLS